MSEKFCPVCKYKNEGSAKICLYCGSPLGNIGDGTPSTTRNVVSAGAFPATGKDLEIRQHEAPKQGIAIYTATSEAPISVQIESEFVLGRRMTGEMNESFVDLRPFGAYEHGVSRRHAMVRRTVDGYEIVDLGSTNGTWLDKQRIVPNRPYPLSSGASVYVGRLQLLMIYQVTAHKE